MGETKQEQLVRFLQNELAIPLASLTLALHQCEQVSGVLPIVLWQYGLISLDQLTQIFDWLEAA